MADEKELDGVLLGCTGPVREIVLNEPERRNPMSPSIMSGLVKACDLLEADDGAAVVIVTGAGSAFCAGGDLRHNDQNLGHGPEADRRFLEKLYEPFLRILDLPMPTIAAINGPAIGGGLALSLLCDIRLAATDAVLKTAFSAIGFAPGMGLTHTLPRHVGLSLASEILYADRSLTGAEAAAVGLVSRAVPPADLLPSARQLAHDIAVNSSETNRLIKTLLTADHREDLRGQLSREIPAQVATSSSEDYRRRRAAMDTARRDERRDEA
jgi:enoyl-CoA hydratase/carnithine racemase